MKETRDALNFKSEIHQSAQDDVSTKPRRQYKQLTFSANFGGGRDAEENSFGDQSVESSGNVMRSSIQLENDSNLGMLRAANKTIMINRTDLSDNSMM